MKKKSFMVAFMSYSLFANADIPELVKKPRKADNDISGFVKGKRYASIGIGAFNLNYTLANALKNSIAPKWNHLSLENKATWFAKGEVAIGKHSGIGLGFAHSGMNVNVKMDSFTSQNIPINGQLSYRSWSFLFRYNYHIISNKRTDFYVGAGVGYRYTKFKVTDNDPIVNRWNFPVDLTVVKKVFPASKSYTIPTYGFEMTVGFRYYIMPPIAVYIEVGMAKSIVQGGVTVRF